MSEDIQPAGESMSADVLSEKHLSQPLYYLASPYNHTSRQKMQERYEANVKALADLLPEAKAMKQHGF